MGLFIFTNDIFCLICLVPINFPLNSTRLKLLCAIYSNRVFFLLGKLEEDVGQGWIRTQQPCMFWRYDGAVYNSVRLKWLLLWWRQCSSLVTTILASSNTPCRSSACETSHPSSFIFSEWSSFHVHTTLRVYQIWWIFSLVVLIWTINGANRWMLAKIWTTIDMNNGCDGNWQAWIDTLMETHKNCLIQGFYEHFC
jgi:hypothetical protein